MGYRNVAGLLAILGLVLLSSFKIVQHKHAREIAFMERLEMEFKAKTALRQSLQIQYDTPAGIDPDLVYPALITSMPPAPATPAAALATIQNQKVLLDGTLKYAFFFTSSGYNATLADEKRLDYPYKGNSYGVKPLLSIPLLASLMNCHVQEMITLEDAVLVKVSVNQPDSPAVLAFGQTATPGAGWSGWLVQARTDVAAPLLAGAGAQDLGQNWWLLPANLSSDEVFSILRPSS